MGSQRSSTPTGDPMIFIVAFAPASATTGDTVIIQLMLPEEIASVQFGGVPAASISPSPFDAKVKAVVGTGASGMIKVSGFFPGSFTNSDSVSGFTFIPKDSDVDVLRCGPIANASLVSNLSGSSYQWQVSKDGTSYLDVPDDTIYNGALTDTLRLSGISNAYHGYKYRCLVNGKPGKVFTIKFQNTWLGVDSNWSNSLNWSCGVVPGSSSNVLISRGNVTLNQSITVSSITIKTGANLTLAPGVVLTVTH